MGGHGLFGGFATAPYMLSIGIQFTTIQSSAMQLQARQYNTRIGTFALKETLSDPIKCKKMAGIVAMENLLLLRLRGRIVKACKIRAKPKRIIRSCFLCKYSSPFAPLPPRFFGNKFN